MLPVMSRPRGVHSGELSTAQQLPCCTRDHPPVRPGGQDPSLLAYNATKCSQRYRLMISYFTPSETEPDSCRTLTPCYVRTTTARVISNSQNSGINTSVDRSYVIVEFSPASDATSASASTSSLSLHFHRESHLLSLFVHLTSTELERRW